MNMPSPSDFEARNPFATNRVATRSVGLIVVILLAALFMADSAHAGNAWCGTQWSTQFASTTGSYGSVLTFDPCTAANATTVHGEYNNGTVDGNAVTDPSGAEKFVGSWTRTNGNSGGACPGGLVDLTLRSGGTEFNGDWTYCNTPVNDRSIANNEAFAWKGEALANFLGKGKDLDIVPNITSCTNNNPPNIGNDGNGFMLNPTFRWNLAAAHCGQMPDPEVLCASSTPGNIDITTCTSLNTIQFDNVGFNVLPLYCDTQGGVDSHSNWFTNFATLTGPIFWESHSTGPFSDDDYNFNLAGPGNANDSLGTTGNAAGRLHMEFNAGELISHFSQAWWTQFRQAVDDGHGTADAMIDGRNAIVTGLLGIDWVHPPFVAHAIVSESHPIWAMAIEIDDSARDNQWAILVRNWGNEGGCSQNNHKIAFPNATYTFSIPKRNTTGTVTLADFYANEGGVSGPLVDLSSNPMATVSFTLPAPDASPRVHGVLHIDWGRDAAPGPRDGMGIPYPYAQGPGPTIGNPPSGNGLSMKSHVVNGDDRDERLSPIFESLSPDQQRRVLKMLPPELPPSYDRLRPGPPERVRTALLNGKGTSQVAVVSVQSDTRIFERIRSLAKAMCTVTKAPVLKSQDGELNCTALLAH